MRRGSRPVHTRVEDCSRKEWAVDGVGRVGGTDAVRDGPPEAE